MRPPAVLVGLVGLALDAAVGTGQDHNRRPPEAAGSALAGLPLHFIENRKVCPDEVAYYLQGTDKTLYFTREGITIRLRGRGRGWVARLEFVNPDPEARPRGVERLAALFSYFKGPEKDWKTGLPAFSRLVYEGLWTGIDLALGGAGGRLKYEFVVRPGADPGQVRLRWRGAESVRVTDAGSLRVETPAGGFEDAPPVAFQEVGGERVEVPLDYALQAGDPATIAFRVGAYDRTRPLVLDPAILVYCGYIGGAGTFGDRAHGVAVDAEGSIYVTGETDSDQQTFPVTVGPDLTYNDFQDAFVAKVNRAGTALVYCGYIGGAFEDLGGGIAVDAAGNAYVTGSTRSDQLTFPVRAGPDLTHNGDTDAFVAKVNPQGTGLAWCGYIGGAGSDEGEAVTVDQAGNAIVAGTTGSDQLTFPVATGPDLTYNGAIDGFVAKVNPQGTGLAWCGYIGGALADGCRAVAADRDGNACVIGGTSSDEQTFPVAVGPDLTFNGGVMDAFIAKVNPQGTGLLYCGYIGGAHTDSGEGIAVDGAGNAYGTGWTWSDERTFLFPVTVGPDLTFNGGTTDAFVAKVNDSGTALLYCGYIGGLAADVGYGIGVDAAGNAFVTGHTSSREPGFPVRLGPDLTHNGGITDAFVAKVNAQGTGLVYCGYIGGASSDGGEAIAADAAGNAWLAGSTASSHETFPVTVGPDLTYNGGFWDAFVAKVSLTHLEGDRTSAPPGGAVLFALTASEDAGLPYLLGSSLGTGPIRIDSRQLGLTPDGLLVLSISGVLPEVFVNYAGTIGANGQAQARLMIPDAPALVGLRIHTAFVTLSPPAPSGIKSISNTFSFTIASG